MTFICTHVIILLFRMHIHSFLALKDFLRENFRRRGKNCEEKNFGRNISTVQSFSPFFLIFFLCSSVSLKSLSPIDPCHLDSCHTSPSAQGGDGSLLILRPGWSSLWSVQVVPPPQLAAVTTSHERLSSYKMCAQFRLWFWFPLVQGIPLLIELLSRALS